MELQKIDKEVFNKMPIEQFKGRIETISTPEQARKAVAFLMQQPLIGFDTETRPCFKKGEVHNVALIQLSTNDLCFLFRINRIGITPELQALLECATVTKIGLSTKDDFHGLNKLTRLTPRGFVELQNMVKAHGIGEAGLSKIYAMLFGKKISKRQQLTNWEAAELTPPQCHYAALDAWACLQIYHRLNQSAPGF